jgi:hypothetical protein
MRPAESAVGERGDAAGGQARVGEVRLAGDLAPGDAEMWACSAQVGAGLEAREQVDGAIEERLPLQVLARTAVQHDPTR